MSGRKGTVIRMEFDTLHLRLVLEADDEALRKWTGRYPAVISTAIQSSYTSDRQENSDSRGECVQTCWGCWWRGSCYADPSRSTAWRPGSLGSSFSSLSWRVVGLSTTGALSSVDSIDKAGHMVTLSSSLSSSHIGQRTEAIKTGSSSHQQDTWGTEVKVYQNSWQSLYMTLHEDSSSAGDTRGEWTVDTPECVVSKEIIHKITFIMILRK